MGVACASSHHGDGVPRTSVSRKRQPGRSFISSYDPESLHWSKSPLGVRGGDTHSYDGGVAGHITRRACGLLLRLDVETRTCPTD